MIEPASAITESYGVLVGRTLIDTSNWSAKVLVINPESDAVVLPPFSCVGNVVQVSVVSIARATSIQPEANQIGPLPTHLEDIVAGSHPSLAALKDILHTYMHVFPAPGEPVTGCTQAVRHDIETNGAPACQVYGHAV